MNKSESIINLSTSLLLFHKAMGKIAKTSNNPFFKSQYADLPSILDAIKEPLQDAGLVILSIPDCDGLTTVIIHAESGEFIEANAVMKPIKSDPQSIGSAITYQRRYSIGSILNLNIDKDDDGNKASNVEGKFNVGEELTLALSELKDCKDLPDLARVWSKHKNLQVHEEFKFCKDNMKKNIQKNNPNGASSSAV